LNLASAMFWPKSNFGFVMTTNIGGPSADEALNKLAPELYKIYSAAHTPGGL
jgi:hypothetical protein